MLNLELKLVEKFSGLTMSKLDLRGLLLSFLLLKFEMSLFTAALISLVLPSILSKLIRIAGALADFLADIARVASPILKSGTVGARLCIMLVFHMFALTALF